MRLFVSVRALGSDLDLCFDPEEGAERLVLRAEAIPNHASQDSGHHIEDTEDPTDALREQGSIQNRSGQYGMEKQVGAVKDIVDQLHDGGTVPCAQKLQQKTDQTKQNRRRSTEQADP